MTRRSTSGEAGWAAWTRRRPGAAEAPDHFTGHRVRLLVGDELGEWRHEPLEANDVMREAIVVLASLALAWVAVEVGTLMVFALMLMVALLVWARAGSAIHVFFPVG